MEDLPLPALKALRRYRPNEPNADDIIQMLSAHNLLAPKFRVDHDSAINDLFNIFSKVEKQHVVDNFILGVEENAPSLRAGLSAYSFMINFPVHSFSSEDGILCKVCGEFREHTVDPTFVNAIRFQAGCMVGNSPTYLAQYLIEHCKTPRRIPSNSNLLARILRRIEDAQPDDTPNVVHRNIRKIPGVKMSLYESRGLLTALGHAGILQTRTHLGLAQAFINTGTAPRKHHSSDWEYPVAFWKGSDGLNEGALQYWFSDHFDLLDGIGRPCLNGNSAIER